MSVMGAYELPAVRVRPNETSDTPAARQATAADAWQPERCGSFAFEEHLTHRRQQHAVPRVTQQRARPARPQQGQRGHRP